MIGELTEQLETATQSKDWQQVADLDQNLKRNVGRKVELCKTPEEAKALMDDLQKLMYAYHLSIEACEKDSAELKQDNQSLHRGLQASKQYLSI
ncbi:MAG: hypothetical protein AseanaTS_13350 [Candidatus Pelagadaptatus aseana]|uniref:hypothetical protein n=1 Tax=Candidatus Pelagadaptatus aseana TaxID=3120508 RepID=UPI0039B2D338